MPNYPQSRELRGPYKPYNFIEASLLKLSKCIHIFGALLIALLMLPVVIDVVLRSFFTSAFPGVMEIETLALSAIAFSGMALNFITRQPIQIDLFYNNFKSQNQARFDLFSYILSIGVCAVLAYQTCKAGLHHGTVTVVLGIPENIFVLYTSFIFAIITLIYLFLILHVLEEMVKAKDFLGILLAILGAVSIVMLPVLYRTSGVRLSGLFIGTFGFSLLICLLLVRVPIGLAMALIGILGSATIARNPWGAFTAAGLTPFRSTTEFILVAIPMFMLMGEFIYHSGLSKDLFECANKWLGRTPGGLASASVAGCAGFGAVSGDSLATVATMTSVALPEMRAKNYDTSLATGALAAGGTLGILIPPSMGFIIYSIITEESIAKLFLAGILPGILLTAIFIGIIAFQVIRNPSLAPKGPVVPLGEKFASLLKLIPIAGLFGLVIGGILSGFFTPGEGGAIGAFGALCFAIYRKKMTKENFMASITATGRMAGKIFVVMVGVNLFGNFLSASRLPSLLANTIVEMNVNAYIVLAAIILIYIFLGCIMSIIPMMMLTLPSIFPTVVALGFDPIWFGVVVVVVMEMGMITPPVGMNVFTMASLAPDIPMSKVFKGVLPFFWGMILCVILLIIFPQIALFLPNMS